MYEPYGYDDGTNYISKKDQIERELQINRMNDKKEFASVEYDSQRQSFIFKNVKGIEVGSANMADIIPQELIEDAYYDSFTKKLIITFVNGKVVSIPLDDLIDVAEAGDGLKQEDGKFLINLTEDCERFLTVDENGLKLSGVQDAIDVERDRAISAETDLDIRLTQEVSDREDGDRFIRNIIGTGFTTNPTETITYKLNDTNSRLSTESDNRMSEDTNLSDRISLEESTRASEISRLEGMISSGGGGSFDPTYYYSKVETNEKISEATADMATETWVGQQGYMKNADLSAYAKVEDIPTKNSELTNDTNYATQQWVEEQGYTSGVDLSDYAKIEDIPTSNSALTNDASYITEESLDGFATEQWVLDQHYISSVDLSDYATQLFVNDAVEAVVGAAPKNFDTLKEFADALADLTVIDCDPYTQEEADEYNQEHGYQPGDEGYVESGDCKNTPRNMTIGEFVSAATAQVDEKPQVVALDERMTAMENALRRLSPTTYQTMMNDLEVLDTLKTENSVTIEEGTIADIIVPETTRAKTITGELDTDATVTLTSRYNLTIKNSGTEETDLTIKAPAVEGYNAATVTLSGGTYDEVTLTDASLTVNSGSTLKNVVITEDTTKALTINAMFESGATVTSNSSAPITITNKNQEGEEVSITLDASGSTVTFSGGKWEYVEANVSSDTLIIKKTAHIKNLDVTHGNVIVEVPRESDITNVITSSITIAEGFSITHLQYDIDNENVSKLGGVAECTLTEDINKSGAMVSPLSPSWDTVWNLNNHVITFTNTRGRGAVMLRYGSKLEVNGNGQFNCAEDYGIWVSAADSKAVINGGVFSAATHALYCEKGWIGGNGGEFHMANPNEADKDDSGNFRFLLNCLDANYKNGTANIVVKGGTFYDFDPSNCAAEGVGTNFVASGYHSEMTTVIVDGVEHRVYTVVED